MPYQAQRARYWLLVEAQLSRGSPQQVIPLKNNLATFYSDTGQWADILCRPFDHPLLYLHFWVLHDWAQSDPALERHVLVASVCRFAAGYTHLQILDSSSQFDVSYLGLAQQLLSESQHQLSYLFPAAAPFWDDYPPFEPDLWTGAKISVAAVAHHLNRTAALPDLIALVTALNHIMQIRYDLTTLRHDIYRRHYSYPIRQAMHAAAIDPQQPVSAERLLGAFVLTNTAQKLGEECHTHLEIARTLSEWLHLPTFGAYWSTVEQLIAEFVEMFSLKTPRQSSTLAMAPAVDTLPTVIDMAARYLRSDLTFRESWEVQRRGIFGAKEVTGRAFPSGLILEILCQHATAHNLSAAVDQVFHTLEATGYRYYDHPHLPPDSDDLALLLRLYQYASHPPALEEPLGWLVERMGETGQIPVWLQPPGENNVSLWGNACAAVEANVLLGLLAYDAVTYRALIDAMGRAWLERIAARGMRAFHHYVPLYSLWVSFQLLDRLSQPTDAARATLTRLFESEVRRPQPSPQEAAFLTLMCHTAPGLADRFKPAWITQLCKMQRYDGAWLAEPLYGTPTRGERATWYASTSVTTAFCYHALKCGRRE